MIDLSYEPKKQPEKDSPEEIAIVIVAVVLWAVIALGWIGVWG